MNQPVALFGLPGKPYHVAHFGPPGNGYQVARFWLQTEIDYVKREAKPSVHQRSAERAA